MPEVAPLREEGLFINSLRSSLWESLCGEIKGDMGALPSPPLAHDHSKFWRATLGLTMGNGQCEVEQSGQGPPLCGTLSQWPSNPTPKLMPKAMKSAL